RREPARRRGARPARTVLEVRSLRQPRSVTGAVTRVAAVDCGTNTIKLLVADIDPRAGTQHSLVRELRIVRLGQDVDRTGRLADEALARVFAAVDEYAAVIAAHD